MNRQKKLYDRRKVDPSIHKYQPGDAVWQAIKTRMRGRAPKLQKKWKGPRLVVRNYTDVTYLVEDEGGKAKVIHFDLLKPYRGEKRPRWLTRRRKEMEEEAEKSVEPNEKEPNGTPATDKSPVTSGEDPENSAGSDGDYTSDEDSE